MTTQSQTGESNNERNWRAADRPAPFFVRHADALYRAVEAAIEAGRIDARSAIGDAALDYRDERDDMAGRDCLSSSFADWLEPFCAGFIASQEGLTDDDGEAFLLAAQERFDNSGGQRAQRFAAAMGLRR